MMKYFVVLIVALLPFKLWSQRGGIFSAAQKVVAGRNLQVGWNKTCMLVFPAAIQSADRGSVDVLAERVEGAENVLKVKAGKPGFEPSSLTVITRDGAVFAFKVVYVNDPPYLVVDLSGELPGISGDAIGGSLGGSASHLPDSVAVSSSSSSSSIVRFKGITLNSAQMEACAGLVRGGDAPFIKRVGCKKQGLDFKLEGIYIHKKVLFFRFRLYNESSIPYKLTSLRFFMRDVKTARRTAVQDNELRPLYLRAWGTPEDEEAEGDESSGQVIVVALRRFTLADHKLVAIELMEKEGDRVLSLRLREENLLQTRKLAFP